MTTAFRIIGDVGLVGMLVALAIPKVRRSVFATWRRMGWKPWVGAAAGGAALAGLCRLVGLTERDLEAGGVYVFAVALGCAMMLQGWRLLHGE